MRLGVCAATDFWRRGPAAINGTGSKGRAGIKLLAFFFSQPLSLVPETFCCQPSHTSTRIEVKYHTQGHYSVCQIPAAGQ